MALWRKACGMLLVGIMLCASAAWAGSVRAHHIDLIVKTLRNPFFEQLIRGAEDAAAQNGAALEVMAPDRETSIAEQMALVRSAIARRVDALVVTPADSKAQQAGIVIVLVDNGLDRDAMSARRAAGLAGH